MTRPRHLLPALVLSAAIAFPVVPDFNWDGSPSARLLESKAWSRDGNSGGNGKGGGNSGNGNGGGNSGSSGGGNGGGSASSSSGGGGGSSSNGSGGSSNAGGGAASSTGSAASAQRGGNGIGATVSAAARAAAPGLGAKSSKAAKNAKATKAKAAAEQASVKKAKDLAKKAAAAKRKAATLVGKAPSLPAGQTLTTLVAAEVETADRPIRAKNRIVAAGLGEQALALLRARGFGVDRVTRGTAGIRVVRLRLPDGMTPEQARDTVRSLEPSATADLDHFYYTEGGHPEEVPGQTAMASLIGWQTTTAANCGTLPTIGLIDTGINLDHEALKGQAIELIRGESAGSDPSSALHGTAVAALLVGRADSRTPGLLPNASLLAINAFYRDGGTADRTDVATLVAAMEDLADRGVGIINLSLSGPPNAVLAAAVKAATDRNIVLIAAAGNKGPGAAPSYPAAYPGVIAVTAVDRNLDLYRRATQGDYVDLAAPGVDVWTAASIRGGRPKTGTSFAVPFVTAAAAVLRAANPDVDGSAVATALSAAARDLGQAGRDPAFGWGLVQAADLCAPLDDAPAIQQAVVGADANADFITPAGGE